MRQALASEKMMGETTSQSRLVHVIIDFVTVHKKVEVVPKGGGHLKRGIIHRSRRWLYIYVLAPSPASIAILAILILNYST
jgi:hypothetical protein